MVSSCHNNNNSNSSKSQGAIGSDSSTDLKSIEAPMTAQTSSQEYSPVAQISIGSYAADLSSPSIDRVQELSALGDIIKGTFDVSIDDGSTVSPLDGEQSLMLNNLAIRNGDESINDEGRVSLSAGWTLQLAGPVEVELDGPLADATEVERNQAKAEDDLFKAHFDAESQVKRLRERLEEMIQESLILEVKLESIQEDMKDKEIDHAREKCELQAGMDAELRAIRTERRELLIRVAALEEENEVLCGKLLAESGNGMKPGLLVAVVRRLKQLKTKAKSFRPLTRRPSRGTPM